jgi:hypothetical protein
MMKTLVQIAAMMKVYFVNRAAVAADCFQHFTGWKYEKDQG